MWSWRVEKWQDLASVCVTAAESEQSLRARATAQAGRIPGATFTGDCGGHGMDREEGHHSDDDNKGGKEADHGWLDAKVLNEWKGNERGGISNPGHV